MFRALMELLSCHVLHVLEGGPWPHVAGCWVEILAGKQQRRTSSPDQNWNQSNMKDAPGTNRNDLHQDQATPAAQLVYQKHKWCLQQIDGLVCGHVRNQVGKWRGGGHQHPYLNLRQQTCLDSRVHYSPPPATLGCLNLAQEWEDPGVVPPWAAWSKAHSLQLVSWSLHRPQVKCLPTSYTDVFECKHTCIRCFWWVSLGLASVQGALHRLWRIYAPNDVFQSPRSHWPGPVLPSALLHATSVWNISRPGKKMDWI